MFGQFAHREDGDNNRFDYNALISALNSIPRRYRRMLHVDRIMEDLPRFRSLFEIPYAAGNAENVRQYAHCIQQLNLLGISNEKIATCLKILDSYFLPFLVYTISCAALSTFLFYVVNSWAGNLPILDTVKHLFSLGLAFYTLNSPDLLNYQAQFNRIIIQIVDVLLSNPTTMEVLLRLKNQWPDNANVAEALQRLRNHWPSVNAVFVNGDRSPTNNKHIKQLEGLGFPLDLVPDEYNCGVYRTIMECPITLGSRCPTPYDRTTPFLISDHPVPVDSQAVVQPFQFLDPSTREMRVYPDDVHSNESLGNEIQAYVDALTEGINNAKNAKPGRYFGLFKQNLSYDEYAAISARAVEAAKARMAAPRPS